MKMNEPFWAAFTHDGELGGSPELSDIGDSKKEVLDEIACWNGICGTQNEYVLRRVKMIGVPED